MKACPECKAEPSAGWGGGVRGKVYHKAGCSLDEVTKSKKRHPSHGSDPDVELPEWATPEGRKAYERAHRDDKDDWYSEQDVIRGTF